jgi:hypothetical protein
LTTTDTHVLAGKIHNKVILLSMQELCQYEVYGFTGDE